MGNTYFDVNSAAAIFEVVKFSHIVGIILPFFDKHLIQGKKSSEFALFKEAAEIVKSGDHLNPEGFQQIMAIKNRMNK